MSQSDKAVLYNKLKDAGVEFDKHYRDYTESDLQAAADRLFAERVEEPAAEEVPPSSFFGLEKSGTADVAPPPPAPAAPKEMAGQRLNTDDPDTVIRVDDAGREWLQEEILKPASPRPRARRVLTYVETGVEEKQIKVGDYIETFEVAGEGPGRTAEVKVTLPSYQVGIFRDPRFPFKVHTYNGQQGFDLFEVQEYYNGAELVPSEIKRIYVENVLCYDIRTTVRAIETEYRQLQLARKVD